MNTAQFISIFNSGGNPLGPFQERVAADGGTVDGLDNMLAKYNASASWQLIPSAVKAGTAYAQVPNTSLGDLTVTRASSGTFTNSAGVVQTAASNVLRTDYRNADGTLSATGRYLLEPQRTNLLLYSQGFDDTTNWVILSSRFTYTKTQDFFNTNNAFVFTETATTDSHNVYSNSANRPVSTSGATYTLSAFFKAGTRRYCGISVGSGGSGVHVFVDTTNWTITEGKRFSTNTNWVYLNSSIQNFGNGWYRVSLIFRTDASLVLIPSLFASNVSTSSSAEPTYLGNGSTIITTGIQLEAGAYATSYIPTTTAAVTRIADNFTRNNIFTNGLISSAGGTWFVEISDNASVLRDNGSGLFIGDTAFANNGNQIIIRSAAPAAAARFSIIRYVSGTATTLHTTTTNKIKVAVKWNGSAMDVFVNGVKVSASNLFTTTTMQNMIAGAGQIFEIDQMLLAATPLSDAQCIQLTTL